MMQIDDIPTPAPLVSGPTEEPAVEIEVDGERKIVKLSDVLKTPREPRSDWNDDGYVIIKNAIPETLMVAYEQRWKEANGYHGELYPKEYGSLIDADRPQGFEGCTPYVAYAEIRDLCAPVAPILADLMGEPAGMHLNLTGWVSTTRNWHQDTYLNPPHVGDVYAAIWVALETIHPDSGPFQLVPGSHMWGEVTRQAMLPCMSQAEAVSHQWPRFSERVLTPLFEAEIARRQAAVMTYLPERGDVLIWHGRLIHRGSVPNTPGMERRAFIGHFSGIHHRPDMGDTVRAHETGGHYFDLPGLRL